MPPPKKRRGQKGQRRVLTFLLLIFPAALIVLPTSIVFGLGLVPTVVAYLIDRDPDKPAPITVGGMNFCGCLPFAIDLWKHGHTIGAAMKVFADPLSWLVMYGSAAVGWAFYYGIPPMVASAEVMRSEKRVDVLKQKKVALVQEWGPDVAGDTFEDSFEGGGAAG